MECLEIPWAIIGETGYDGLESGAEWWDDMRGNEDGGKQKAKSIRLIVGVLVVALALVVMGFVTRFAGSPVV